MSDPSLLNWTYLVLLEDPWLNFCFIYTLRHYQFWCKNLRNVKSPYIFLLFLEFQNTKNVSNYINYESLNFALKTLLISGFGTKKPHFCCLNVWRYRENHLTCHNHYPDPESDIWSKNIMTFCTEKKIFCYLDNNGWEKSQQSRFEFISSLLSLIRETLMMKSSRLLWNANWQTSELYCPLRPFYSFGFSRGEVRITFCNLWSTL